MCYRGYCYSKRIHIDDICIIYGPVRESRYCGLTRVIDDIYYNKIIIHLDDLRII